VATEIIIPPVQVEHGRSFLQALEAMGAERRLAIYRSGGFTGAERTLWAANYPEEVPLVNDEFEWIALAMADLD
jgi:hypothetical protein